MKTKICSIILVNVLVLILSYSLIAQNQKTVKDSLTKTQLIKDIGRLDSKDNTYTFELTWDEKVDLDLYLFLTDSANRRDTIYWRKPKVSGIRRLNVDDNDGFGPERITLPLRSPFPGINGNSQAELKVHYYSPRNGKPTKATVIVYRDNVVIKKFGPCTLYPFSSDKTKLNLWNVVDFKLSANPIEFIESNHSLSLTRDSTLHLIQK